MRPCIDHNLYNEFLRHIRERITGNSLEAVRYLDLGVTVIRVLCYTKDIIPIMEKQLSYVMKEDLPSYDSTIAVYLEPDADSLAAELFKLMPLPMKMRARAQMLYLKEKHPSVETSVIDSASFIDVLGSAGIVEAYDDDLKTVYYGLDSFEPEKIVKHGHCFVRIINRLAKTPASNLTHGAVLGYNGNGVLLCGRGKRGKSTLTVNALLNGFEFVSDDYQLLEQTEKGLLAYPIYSIITLSYRMYNEMYDIFKGKFVSNNFAQDKYLFNISSYHDRFRIAYPVRLCLFPQIVADSRPGIHPCTAEEKGRAIVHLIHSTLIQMGELGDRDTIRKLLDMIKELPFYRIDLCPDIAANTACLREFLEAGNTLHKDTAPLPLVLRDITYGLATFLDRSEYKFYAMNKFATDLYRLLCNGISPENICRQLESFTGYNPDILNEFSALRDLIFTRGLYAPSDWLKDDCTVNKDFAEKSDYHLSVYGYTDNFPVELLKVNKT